METRTDEIADGVYRFSTAIDGIGPQPFTFNQFLIDADAPMLFHLGQRGFFPSVSAAVARVTPLARIRYLSFGHVEADECGSLNQWLAAAPTAEVIHSRLGCQVSLNDLADRPPRALGDGEVIDLGGRKVRWIDTPHVPHGWEAGAIWEEITGRCSAATSSPTAATVRPSRRRYHRSGVRDGGHVPRDDDERC